MRHSNTLWMLAIVTAIFVLIFLNLVLGSVSIPLQSVWHIIWNLGNEPITWQNIIWKSRLPQALTALVAGAGLSISGSLSVMALIVYVSQKVKGNVTLLIIGVMIGYVANAVIGVLKFFSVEEDIRAYVIWGLGSFARVSGNQMTLFVILMTILIPLSFLLIKTMNLMLLGDSYARNLGLNIKRARLLVITSAGVLTAIVTAYCGPIIFLGLAVPHLCRAIFQTSDHRILMPAVLFAGAALALICNLIARMPGFEGALPVNSVTALVGAPVVASVLFRKRKNELNE